MNIEELSRLTLAELASAYRRGSTDPVEVIEVTLRQIEAVNPDINALYEVTGEIALAEAQLSRARHHAGTPIGLLDGVPVTIKDSVHAIGRTWHHGSAAHGLGVVGSKDAPPVEKLKAGGAIILGKATMPDFGLSGSGVSSLFGVVRNPWGLAWNTGGSSAGAGASIAAGIGMMSLGSDIAGSVRLPASHCGLAALKPTQGMIAHTPPSDVRSAGPIARYAADLEAWLFALGGVHQEDRFSVPVTEPASASLTNYVVGAYSDFGFGQNIEPAVHAVFENACKVMASIVAQVRNPATPYDFDAYLPIDDSLKLRGWREYDGVAVENRGNTPTQLIDWFAEASSWDGRRIAEVERGLARGVAQTNRLFVEGLDFVITPVMPVVNFPAEQLGPDFTMPLRHTTFTAPFNQSGHPAVSICAGFDKQGLPVGVQIVGRRFDDVRLVRLAAALEAALWSSKHPRPNWPTAPRAGVRLQT